MSDKLKITIWVAGAIVATILLFCLIVIIGCSVNGLTFGEQVCVWFAGSTTVPESPEQVEDAIETVASMAAIIG